MYIVHCTQSLQANFGVKPEPLPPPLFNMVQSAIVCAPIHLIVPLVRSAAAANFTLCVQGNHRGGAQGPHDYPQGQKEDDRKQETAAHDHHQQPSGSTGGNQQASAAAGE